MTEERFESIETRMDRIEAAMEHLTQSQIRAFEGLSTLTQIVEAEREDSREALRTNSAALERIDRVLDYLMRRDGEV
jgi:hypothetical protein